MSMRISLPPSTQIVLAVAMSLICAAAMIALATQQRYLGLHLSMTQHGPPLEGIGIERIAASGPAGALPLARAEGAGLRLVFLEDAEGNRLRLVAQDMIEEPDTLASYAEIDRLLARQNALARLLRSEGPVMLGVLSAGVVSTHAVTPAPRRPLSSLPVAFWVQIGVGLSGFWTGMWVFALRRQDRAPHCLALSGGGLMLSAFAAAVYSTRELALPGALFQTLSALNHFGAFVFGIGMIGLFMLYPKPLFAPRWVWVPAIVLTSWFGLAQLRVIATPQMGIHFGVVVALGAILALVLVQYARTKGEPRDRAALKWLGLAVLIGSGAFVITVIAPTLLGLNAVVSQATGFVFFLIVYLGVALGVARFQLFQLEIWAFRVLFYTVGAMLLLALDALLVFTVIDERASAFAISLLIVALIWLPLRDSLARRLLDRSKTPRPERFGRIMDVALTPPEADPQARWTALLVDMFNPLRIDPAEPVAAPHLRNDGLSLVLPGRGALVPVELCYGHGGARLFTVQDLELATEMDAMLAQALESRMAYEQGVNEERARIARDIHDNIGIQLMAALHSAESTRKDMMIRGTLTDLRDIINNAADETLPVEEMLADLRAQIADQMQAVGIALQWQMHLSEGVSLPIQHRHTLRSTIREAIQNVLKHADAQAVSVRVDLSPADLRISIADDGRGLDPALARQGHGLSNARARAEALGGSFEIASGPTGTRLAMSISLAALSEAS